VKIKKEINLGKVRKILLDFIEDLNYNLNDRIEIYRFLHKLSDSENFEIVVNKQLSGLKMKLESCDVEEAINSRKKFFMRCGFMLKPVQGDSWELYQNNELFLDSLDKKVARKIAFDINVAYVIKLSRGG
jgi:hypothetical protein